VRRTAIQRDTRATRRRRSLRLRPPLFPSASATNQWSLANSAPLVRPGPAMTRLKPHQRIVIRSVAVAWPGPAPPTLPFAIHALRPPCDAGDGRTLTVSLASPARSLSPPRNHGRFPFPLRYPLIFLRSPRRQQGWCWCVCSAFADSPPGRVAVRRRRRPNCVGTWTTTSVPASLNNASVSVVNGEKQ
jgi:hypothetical protein